MTEKLNQQQVNEVLRRWPLRQEARPAAEYYAAFKPIKEQWERLRGIPEAQRTPWQHEAHAALLAELIAGYDSPWFAWNRTGLSDTEMNAAAQHYISKL